MKPEENSSLKDRFTDLLSQIAFSTIYTFAGVLSLHCYQPTKEELDSDDSTFDDRISRTIDCFTSFLVLAETIPEVLIEKTELFTSQYIEVMNMTLKLFRYPETFISPKKELQEKQFLTLAVLETRFKCLLEDLVQGILNGDEKFYHVSEDTAKIGSSLYKKEEIEKLSIADLKEELKNYYSDDTFSFDPFETEEMLDYLY